MNEDRKSGSATDEGAVTSAAGPQASVPGDSVVEDVPWEPEPLTESAFSAAGAWKNINRSPYDRVSGVLYKRAMTTKSVRYAPLDPTPELSELWQGYGETVVRWLFSEEPGTEEGLLQRRDFRALQTLTLSPGAATGQRSHPGQDTILLVLDGRGKLNHRASIGAPIVQRPLRQGDLVLIDGSELYSIGNDEHERALNLLVLHLGECEAAEARHRDG